MTKTKVLFVCVHNAGRSQMAEVWLKHLGGEQFDAQSAEGGADRLHGVGTEEQHVAIGDVQALAEFGLGVTLRRRLHALNLSSFNINASNLL